MQTSNNCHNNNNINNISTTNSSNDNIHTPPHTHNPTVTTNNFWMLSAYVPKPMGLGATLLITFKHCLYSCCAHRWSWTGLSIKWAHCGDRTTCHTTEESMKHNNETHVSCVCGHVPYNFGLPIQGNAIEFVTIDNAILSSPYDDARGNCFAICVWLCEVNGLVMLVVAMAFGHNDLQCLSCCMDHKIWIALKMYCAIQNVCCGKLKSLVPVDFQTQTPILVHWRQSILTLPWRVVQKPVDSRCNCVGI